MTDLGICNEHGWEVLQARYESSLRGNIDEGFESIATQVLTDGRLDEIKAKDFIIKTCTPKTPPAKTAMIEAFIARGKREPIPENRFWPKAYDLVSSVVRQVIKTRTILDPDLTGSIVFDICTDASGKGKILNVDAKLSGFEEFERSLLKSLTAKLAEEVFAPEFYNKCAGMSFVF